MDHYRHEGMRALATDAARAIVAELGPFETAVDIAIARGGRVIASLAEGRIEAQVGPATGHAAIMNAVATVSALGQARDGMVATRRELALARAKVGLQEVAIGSLMGCPDEATNALSESEAVSA